jgi:hypothetical protein
LEDIMVWLCICALTGAVIGLRWTVPTLGIATLALLIIGTLIGWTGGTASIAFHAGAGAVVLQMGYAVGALIPTIIALQRKPKAEPAFAQSALRPIEADIRRD